jgi:hypothetical protein
MMGLLWVAALMQDAPAEAVSRAIGSTEWAALKGTVRTACHSIDLEGSLRMGYQILEGTGEVIQDMPLLENRHGPKNRLEFSSALGPPPGPKKKKR